MRSMSALLITVLASMLAGSPATVSTFGMGNCGSARTDPWPLETLVQRCDRIVEASVSAIEELEVPNWDRTTKTIRLIDLEVREVFWGEPGLKRVTVVAESSLDLRLGPFTKGEVDLWFLERWRFPVEAVIAKRPLDPLDPVGLQVVACVGLGRLPVVSTGADTCVLLRADLLALPSGYIASPISPPEGSEGSWVRAERVRFASWIRRTLDAQIPSVDVEWYSTGDWRRRIQIRPDGHCTFDDDGTIQKERLPMRALANVLATAESEHFFELPGIVGKSLGPDSSALFIRIRTARGSRRVQVNGPCDPATVGQASDDTCDRAKRVLHSVPHAETWVVTGH
jgi:hypothetical protein